MQLLIAEKPSAARDLARTLDVDDDQGDYLQGNGYVISWCVGHVAQLAPPAHYKDSWANWSIKDLPILPDPLHLQVQDRARSRWSVLEELLTDSSFDAVINACDAGREGELIFRNVYRLSRSDLRIRRLWLSDLTPAGIRRAVDDIRPGHDYDNLAAAARARSEADWIIGLNATRALTLTSNGQQVLSLGRVQTPTLALVVQRDKEIENFEPQPFWRVHAEFQPNDTEATFEAVWHDDDTKRLWDKADATAILEALEEADAYIDFTDDSGPAVVTSAETKQTTSHSPSLYDLTSLQRRMNSRHGLTSSQTLQAAQSLYEQKALTYPRTDSQALPSTLTDTFKDRLRIQSSFPWYDGFDIEDSSAIQRHIDDDAVTDHHAIVPTEQAPDLESLDAAARHVYEAVARRFLAAFMPPAAYEKMRLDVDVDGHAFRAEARAQVFDGWHAVDPPESSGDDLPTSLPSLAKGDHLHIANVRLHEGHTRPPSRYNENSLLAAMENCGEDLEDADLRTALDTDAGGLGTPATRANILEKLLDRDYLQRKGKQLRSTQLGRELIDALPGTALTSPELTARWEVALQMIEEGELSADNFLTKVKDRTVGLINNLTAETLELPSLAPEALGECPLCGRDVYEADTVYTCQSGRDCDFFLGQSILGRKLPSSEIETLLEGDKTRELDGFTSKDGGDFSARLSLDEDAELDFHFE